MKEEDPFAFLEEEEEEDKEKFPLRKGMPKKVPILTERDLCWQGDHGPGKPRCLDAWFYWVFSSGQKYHRGKFPDDVAGPVLKKVLSERLGKKVVSLWTFSEWVGKHREPSLRFQARAWNEMLRRLGYDVPWRKCKDPGA